MNYGSYKDMCGLDVSCNPSSLEVKKLGGRRIDFKTENVKKIKKTENVGENFANFLVSLNP